MGDMTTLCTQCGAFGSIEAVRLDEMSGDGQTGGAYRCSECLAHYGIWIEAGEVDLAAVRERVDASDGKFEIFP
jgi:hypothetical protein